LTGGVEPGAGGLISTTKLSVPRLPRSAISRPQLVERLTHADYRLALVVAPAGFGKTSVLVEWVTSHPDPVAWLSCDDADAEPAHFWTGLLAAVGARWPGAGDDAAVLLRRDGTDSRNMAVSLGNDLGVVGRPAVIVVDDLHLAGPSPGVLPALIGALPGNVQLVLGSRADPPFSVAKLRLAGQLLELRSRDLRFSAEEAAELLARAAVPVDGDEVGRLYELSEGWPAGLQLAALSLERTADRRGFLDAFARSDRAMSDFLVGEVLDRQPPDQVEFLMATSVLDRFDAGLCEAVTGDHDARARLDRLIAENLFLTALDDAGEWYRYHHLFGAFLRARLRSVGADRQQEAHRRASQALAARGDLVEAIRQATAAGDIDGAAELVLRGMTTLNVADTEVSGAAARAWLHANGRGLLATDPLRVLGLVAVVLFSSDPADVATWLEKVELANPEPSPELESTVGGEWAEYHLSRGRVEEGLAQSEAAASALGRTTSANPLLSAIRVVRVRAHLQAGDLRGAKAVLDDPHPVQPPLASIDEVRLPALRAYVAAAEGELPEAQRLSESAAGAAEELGLPVLDIGRGYAALAMSATELERDEREGAARYLERARACAEAGGRSPIRSRVELHAARWWAAAGDEALAHGHLSAAGLLFPDASPGLRAVFDEEAARLALRFDDLEQAADLLARLPDSPTTLVLRSRLALAEADPRLAADLLGQAEPGLWSRRQQVELGVLRALCRRDRDPERAAGELAGSIRLAQPVHLVRTIIDLGPAVPKLLASFPAGPGVEGYVDLLVRAADGVIAPLRSSRSSVLVDPLSSREITVLRYLSSRLTHQEMAAALFVSPNTLKSHTKSVYRKLGVGSRAEAVRAGRALGLI
jgi:LuxR family maltose regulon positive regulatory protein